MIERRHRPSLAFKPLAELVLPHATLANHRFNAVRPELFPCCHRSQTIDCTGNSKVKGYEPKRTVSVEKIHDVVHSCDETEVPSDLSSAMSKLESGAEIIIEREHKPVAIIRPAPGWPDNF